jgi:hypothetical protein
MILLGIVYNLVRNGDVLGWLEMQGGTYSQVGLLHCMLFSFFLDFILFMYLHVISLG